MGQLTAFGSSPLALSITEEQRDRSVDYLQQAYAQGRLTEYELDERLHLVLVASNRAELNRAFVGLANVPMTATRAPLLDTSERGFTGRNLAAIAHWSGLATWAIGPAAVYAVSPAKSFARKEAAKAVNFQVLMGILMTAASFLPESYDGPTVTVIGVLWLLLTLVGGLKAHRGVAWKNPVQRVLPLKIAREDGSKGPISSRPALGR